MTFTVDHSASNAKKPAGRYEVIVEQVKPSFTRKNNPCLNFVLVIRNDVDNPVKGGKLFCSLYKKKQPTAADLAVDGYSAAQIQGWCKAARIENGRHFERLEDLCQALVGALVSVELSYEAGEGDRSYERVSWPEVTHFPDCKHRAAAAPGTGSTLPPAVGAEEFTEMGDDDVPF